MLVRWSDILVVGLLLETAALAQKNSEAQALAVQEDILEKELSEIQKVSLASRSTSKNSLNSFLQLGKNGKSWESKPLLDEDLNKSGSSNLVVEGLFDDGS